MRFIDAAQVYELIDFPELVEGLEAQHREAPPEVDRLLMEQSGSDGPANRFLLWPAWQGNQALGIKLVTIFPENPTRRPDLPVIQAVYILFDGTDGQPIACIDGTALTYLKTAADSALGAKHLAREDARRLLMVGAGAMAPWLIKAHKAVRPSIHQVRVWNRTPAQAEAVAARGDFGVLEIAATADLEQAAREADVICCATGATEPLIKGEWLKPGAHLDLVGSYTNEMREADDEAARRARIFVDTRWFTIGGCGDISGPIASGAITEADVLADLFELCRGDVAGRRDEQEITLFKNAGSAHLDLMTARLIVDRAARAG